MFDEANSVMPGAPTVMLKGSIWLEVRIHTEKHDVVVAKQRGIR